jgi:hypothetical protein
VRSHARTHTQSHEYKKIHPAQCKQVGWLVWLLLYAHRHWSILGAAGHIILTPANQLMLMVLKIWLLSPIRVRTSNLSITGSRSYQLLQPGPQHKQENCRTKYITCIASGIDSHKKIQTQKLAQENYNLLIKL